MRIPSFQILWPGGNTTAIVTDVVSREKYAAVAREIMKTNNEIEQVGYLEMPRDKRTDIRLQMMGGEFCVNAARSAAYHWSRQNGISKVTIEVSGSEYLFEIIVRNDEVTIGLPGLFYKKSFSDNGNDIVDLDGIRHILVDGEYDESIARKLVTEFNGNYQAVGVMFNSKIGCNVNIDSFVWVRETNSFVHETGCGSGSIATAIGLNQKIPRITSYKITQPSGAIYNVCLEFSKGVLENIQLSGIVRYKNS